MLRALGVAIRDGHDAGEIVRNGQIGGTGRPEIGTRSSAPEKLVSPSAFFTNGQEKSETYAMTDLVTGEVF
ncbi:hypothetical protein D9V30_05155 [Mycetocola reblochoni]|uniref:Uncharacterized protein n=1 Tax=Mycetocola reblochoni TaxID=331618 RepID=A0A3L6ZQY2_9MICO|nr:hypothetical protein [Mycetocola reblochoni]RLP70055.1 hypothetical protein D9V30_05155 [Mycetocola reblochoni]